MQVMKKSLPAWLIILGIAGFLLYVFNFQNAFPTASLDFKLPRQKVQELNTSLSKRLGFSKESKFKTTVFHSNNSIRLFLQHNFGPREADLLIKNQIPCFFWSTRLCSPEQLEEFNANRTPEGKLRYFEHNIPNDLPLPDISEEVGAKKIREFLAQETDLSLDGYKLLSFQSEKRNAHKELTYVFERIGPDFKGSQLRMSFTLSGSKLTRFDHFLHTPDSWDLQYRSMLSYNKILFSVAMLFLYSVIAVSFLYFFKLVINKEARWSLALRAAFLISIFSALSVIVNLPVHMHSYSTQNKEVVFYLSLFFQIVEGMVLEVILFVPVFVVGEAVYRKLGEKQSGINNLLNKKGLSQNDYSTSILTGVAICGIWQGWQNIYFWLGSYVGISTPLFTDHPEVYGSYIPCFDLMFIGTSASFQEEILSRVIVLLVLQKFCRNFWLANFLQAFLWSLGHTTYPASPAWARVAELTVSGCMAGVLFRKYGLLPLIVAHYLFDAFEPTLFRANDWQLVVSGVIAILPPFLLYALSKYWQSKNIEPESVPESQTISPPKEPALSINERKAQPISVGFKKGLIAMGLVLPISFLLLIYSVEPTEKGLNITRKQAIEIADAYIAKNNLKDDSLNISVQDLSSYIDIPACQCLQDKMGKKNFKSLFKKVFVPQVWQVRYCSESQIKEMTVRIDASKKLVTSFDYTLAEKDKGAKPDKKDAIDKIETFLNEYHKDLFPLKLVGSKIIERENRRDVSTQWECQKFGTSDTRLMLECSTVGDTVSDFWKRWELPDKWKWKYQEMTPRRALGFFLCFIEISLICALSIHSTAKLPEDFSIDFMWVVKYLSLTGLLWIECLFLQIPSNAFSYQTGTPFILASIQGFFEQLSSLFTLSFLGILLMLSPNTRAQLKENTQPHYSIFAGYTLAIVFIVLLCGLFSFADSLSNEVNPDHFSFTVIFARSISPALLAISLTAIFTLFYIPAQELIYTFFDKYVYTLKRQLFLFTLTSLSVALTTRQSHDCILVFILTFTSLQISWLALDRIFRHDSLAFGACVYAVGLIIITWYFLYTARNTLFTDALICSLALILPFAIFEIRRRYFV